MSQLPSDPQPQDVDRFILERIDTVPHLEALLLLWSGRPEARTVEEMAEAIYVPPGRTKELLQDLVREELIEEQPGPPERYAYPAGPRETDALVAAVEAAYRKELIRISRMIHSKAPAPVRAFAQAFRFTKEKH